LYYAALCGFYDVAKYLHWQGPGGSEHEGAVKWKLPWWQHCSGKHFRVAELLHQHGAEVDIHGWSNRTPLCVASIE